MRLFGRRKIGTAEQTLLRAVGCMVRASIARPDLATKLMDLARAGRRDSQDPGDREEWQDE